MEFSEQSKQLNAEVKLNIIFQKNKFDYYLAAPKPNLGHYQKFTKMTPTKTKISSHT